MGAVTDEDEKGLRGIPCLIGTGLRLLPDDVFVGLLLLLGGKGKRGERTGWVLFQIRYYHTSTFSVKGVRSTPLSGAVVPEDLLPSPNNAQRVTAGWGRSSRLNVSEREAEEKNKGRRGE